ncbi:DUF748 domain-containing protein [Planktosalinus lacus]|uniref:DUF748 domain-containing protein n=1 Tax=Planktosalinus lacus TaxID=1526573 RepID=A0A8J2V848_9FLAO|nr:DUF748 domain-containing protein [Planktosalinus lacus]GGD86354.1 hypothetical protein GCM10011312_07970 [Planktosalinus lacus]
MSKRTRIILGSITGFLILFVIASFVANPIIESKIKKTIVQEVPDGFQLNEYEISVSSFSGSATIENLQISVTDTIAEFKDAQLSLSKASFEGLSYWTYLFSGKIDFNSITLYDLYVKTYRDSTKTDDRKKQQKDFEENISTEKFTLENASFLMKNADESNALQLDSLNFSITDVKVNNTTLQEKIPFHFSEMEVDTKDFFYELNENETLSLKEFTIVDQHLKIKDFAIQTKSDSLKPNLEPASEIGRKDIKIPSLTLSDLHFKVIDSTFMLFGEDLEIKNPSVWIQEGIKKEPENIESTQKENNKKTEMPLPFSIASISINDAETTLLNPDESSFLQVEDFNITLKEVLVNTATLQHMIPCQFSDVEFDSKSIQYQLNDYDLLSLTTIYLSNQELQIEDLAIKTKYSKRELSKVLDKERDHMDAEMPLVTLQGLQFKVSDSTFQVSGNNLIIENPVLKIYRDKLVTDDTSIKPLYSKSIRNIPFQLTLDSLHINNGSITYEEKVNIKQSAGTINFSNLNASIGNVSNTYAQGEKKTTIHINSTFMDESPLKIDWSFDVNDLKDTFQIQGELDALNATKMNSFTKASLNVELEGKVKKTYFNIHGDNDTSSVDLRISYDNFKVEILNKENKRSWLLSAVANIFVKKNSDSKGANFKEGNATAERNKDKSFFNYLWINIQEGLKDVMVSI